MTRRCPPRRPQHRKLPLPQLRQKPQQTIHDQEPTLGRCKKLPIGKSKPAPLPVGPAFVIGPNLLLPTPSPPRKPSSWTSPASGASDKSRIASTIPWRPISQTRLFSGHKAIQRLPRLGRKSH